VRRTANHSVSRGPDWVPQVSALSVRYVITDDSDNACVQDELELTEVYRGEGVRVYEVPDQTV
jgi:hypothetical protein